jgi:hypothetical protein
VLTDGDAPVSGRFDRQQRNTSPCPAEHGFPRDGGGSDAKQMAAFASRNRRDLRVTPLVFEPERRALTWCQLAEKTGGALVRAPGAAAIDAVLPALVARRITRVVARNLRSGAETGELRQADGAELRGVLPLLPGANDVELAVESDRGTAALFRFRIYSAAGELERALAELRARNRGLEVRSGELDDAARAARAEAARRALEIRGDVPPAAPAH